MNSPGLCTPWLDSRTTRISRLSALCSIKFTGLLCSTAGRLVHSNTKLTFSEMNSTMLQLLHDDYSLTYFQHRKEELIQICLRYNSAVFVHNNTVIYCQSLELWLYNGCVD